MSIKNKINNKIQDIIFKTIRRKEKIECNFCAGVKTDCTIYSKIIDFPKILIIVLEMADISEINLKENLKIINDNIRYTLICFISQDHAVYFKKGNEWNLYDKNYDEQKIRTLDNIYPIALFYELEKNNDDQFFN
jgi:formiminotetrahydrofolate cyclodeaminase